MAYWTNFLVLLCSISQEVPARAVDDADVPVWGLNEMISMSVRVVLDFLNQFSNAGAMQLLHCGMWWSGMLKSMSSSLISRLNSLSVLSDATSRCTSGACWSFTMCAFELSRSSGWIHREFAQQGCFHTDYQVSPDRSEEQSSSCKRFSSISWERDVSPLTTNPSCVLSDCPDRSQIGFGIGWVSWENVA